MELINLAQSVGSALQQRGLMLATAESCTGGWVAQVMTAVPGSSQWFERGFVTYSNAAKCEMLGVSAATLAQSGAVSEEVVAQMVAGALRHSHAQVALAISGIAGPDGGSVEKPVGTLCLAWGMQDHAVITRRVQQPGEREAVRQAAVVLALNGVLALLQQV
ncbi:MAG: nicotinamide-nucleotide amidohydrolase family protein [Pseudomonadota bacterium]|nr:nicotinamide-nucleotide amidohydrolase family protein [Pseudomonadota bacterium]